MNQFVFELAPWESFLDSQNPGSTISALQLFSFIEEEDDDTIDDIFQELEKKQLVLDMTGMPKAAGSGSAALRLKQEQEFVLSGMNLHTLEQSDPLRMYLEELAAIPAAGDEDILLHELSNGKSDATLALTNLGLSRVIELAAQYVGYGVFLLDLIQEGSIGLWQGIHSYTSGSYAAHRDNAIRNALTKAVLLQAKSLGIGQKMRQLLQDYRDADEKLLSELGRNAALEEIAEELRISPDEAETVRKMLADAASLQKAVPSPAAEESEQEEELAVEDTAYFQMRQRISDLLADLSPQDAKLLTLRFGLEKGLPMSPEDTAKALRMTPAEVNAREAAALAKLREKK